MCASTVPLPAANQPEPRTQRDLNRTIARNTAALTIANWLAKALNVIFVVVAVRYLGETGLGKYATVVAFVGLFSVFFELGLAQYVERSIAQDREDAWDLLPNLLILRLILAVGGVVVLTGLAGAAGYESQVVLGVFLFALTFLLAALLVPLTTAFTARERFDLAAVVQLVGQVLNALVGLTFLALGAGFLALLLTGFIVMPLQIALSLRLRRRHGLPALPRRVVPSTWPMLIRASLPFGLTSLALVFNFNVDTVIIGLFHPASEVGWYNAAYRLVFNAVGLVGGFLVAMTPSLAREHVVDPQRVARWVQASLAWMTVFALPAAAGLSLLAAPVVALLYGADFAPSALALAIIAWDIPLVLLLSFFGNVTAATGRERPAAAIYLAATGLNLALNLALIPRFGKEAAAAVTVVTDTLSVLLFLALLRAMIGIPAYLGHLARVCVATALMAAVVWAMRPSPLPVVIAVGACVYVAAALPAGVLRYLRLAEVRHAIRRRGARPVA